MHATRFVFATLVILVWAASVHAQPRGFERFHPRARIREHSLPPMPRHGFVEEHATVWRAPVEPPRVGRGGDGSLCDNPDGDPDAAIAACERIIARGPIRGGYSMAVAFSHRGQAYENKADYDHAIADFSQAILLKPGVSGYFTMRAVAAEKSGKTDAARGDFRMASNLDPTNQDALNGLKRVETRSIVSTGGASASPPAPDAVTPPSPPAGTSAPAALVAAISPTPPAVTIAPVAPVAAATTAAPGGTATSSASAGSDRTAAAATAPPTNSPATSSPSGTVAMADAAATLPRPAVSASASSTSTTPAPNDTLGARVALVIGNGKYVNANVLPNPPNDAHAMAGALREIGFDVQEGENLDRASMETQLREFLHKASNASIVLLFYAGHGMQVDGKNYLVPVDAKLAEASDLPFETIEIDKVLDSLGDPRHTNIILLDACRDNPLARSFASHLPASRSAAVPTGLAAYSAVGTGTLIAYATAPGQTALDGQGADSPFTTSLLHNIKTPGLEIRQVLTRVRAEVASATGNKQIPWDNSSLMGDVVLVKQDAPEKTAEH